VAKVVITEAAFTCLQDIESFKSNVIGADEAASLADEVLMESVSAISEDPLRYRVCTQLADYGLQVRERIDRHGYRTLYEVKDDVAQIILVLHTRQDIVLALYRHMILRRST